MKKRVNKIFMKNKGQVSIFIIIAIIIVVFAALIYIFYPKIQTTLGFGEVNPYVFMQTCLEQDIQDSVNTISSQGGSLNPENYILYQDEKIEYLCYTNENYQTCVMQQPMLKKHIEFEIKNNIQDKADNCFNSLKKSYEKKGYDVNLKAGEMKVELLPKKIKVKFNNELDLSSSAGSQKYEKFNINLNNNLYELVNIANSILNYEATYGDSETTIYMNYYHNIKVEKLKQGDGSTIYTITNRDKGNKFTFASRSVAWPAGY